MLAKFSFRNFPIDMIFLKTKHAKLAEHSHFLNDDFLLTFRFLSFAFLLTAIFHLSFVIKIFTPRIIQMLSFNMNMKRRNNDAKGLHFVIKWHDTK